MSKEKRVAVLVILLGAVGFSSGRHFGGLTDASVQGCFAFGLDKLLSDASFASMLSACFFSFLWHGLLIGGGCLTWGTLVLACLDFFGLCFKCGVTDGILTAALKWNSLPVWGITGALCSLFGLLLVLAVVRRMDKHPFRFADRYDRRYAFFILLGLCLCTVTTAALYGLLRFFHHPLCGLWLTKL